MSTFSGLNTAYTALVAARQGLDVVGQNIANSSTAGYTRQRVNTSAIGSVAQVGPLTARFSVGQGVSVDGIARLGNTFLDARARTASASSGYWDARSSAMSTLEGTLQEPGANGVSASLQKFWAAWSDLGNNAGKPAPAAVLLSQANALAAQVATGYQQVDQQWASQRAETEGNVTALNDAGKQIADLNARIRTTVASGAPANEMVDQRNVLAATVAKLAGGTVRESQDGTVEVLIGGNALVSGTIFNEVKLTGSYLMAGAGASPVQLEWASRPGSAVALDGGSIAGGLAVLAPADGSGTGGALAEAAETYNTFATQLATQVNAIHSAGVIADNTTGHAFFGFNGALPAALGLTVVPTDVTTISTGTGGFDGSVADAIAQIGVAASSPDSVWSAMVSGIGAAARSANQQSSIADLTTTTAVGAQLSNSSVDLDEENMNMLTYQRAYQGAARVMTAVDELLDTLINHTGLVGR
ncbi:MAG: flagellar hook-associated protein FlgK [Lacisediminihabitans sp.]